MLVVALRCIRRKCSCSLVCPCVGYFNFRARDNKQTPSKNAKWYSANEIGAVGAARCSVDVGDNDDLVPALECVDLATGAVISTVTSVRPAGDGLDEVEVAAAPCGAKEVAPKKPLIEMIGGDDDFDGLD